jgi:GNAT superfamily N-acetyltransferase
MSGTEIARAVERKRQAATIQLAAISEAVADGVMAFDELGSFVNRSCGLGVDGPVSGDDLDRLVAFYAKHGDRATIEVSSYADASLLDGLGARGFVLDQLTHMLARELVDGEDLARLAHGAPRGVAIERVDRDDAELVRAYVTMVTGGFVADPAAVPASHLRVGTMAVKRAEADAFVARLDGEIVGAGGSESGDGMTALMGATVKASHRRRGIQRALMVARMEQARRRGSRIATVGSAPNGPTERNAARLGFRMVYTRFRLVRSAPLVR